MPLRQQLWKASHHKALSILDKETNPKYLPALLKACTLDAFIVFVSLSFVSLFQNLILCIIYNFVFFKIFSSKSFSMLDVTKADNSGGWPICVVELASLEKRESRTLYAESKFWQTDKNTDHLYCHTFVLLHWRFIISFGWFYVLCIIYSFVFFLLCASSWVIWETNWPEPYTPAKLSHQKWISGNVYHVCLRQVWIRLLSLALKPKWDITKSPKQVSLAPKMDMCPTNT